MTTISFKDTAILARLSKRPDESEKQALQSRLSPTAQEVAKRIELVKPVGNHKGR